MADSDGFVFNLWAEIINQDLSMGIGNGDDSIGIVDTAVFPAGGGMTSKGTFIRPGHTTEPGVTELGN